MDGKKTLGWSGMRRWILALLFLVSLIIVILGFRLISDFADFTAATYGQAEILPEQDAYCPGDRVFYEVSVERKRPGIIRIVESWCRVGGFCAVSLTTDQPAIIPYESPPERVRTHRVLPNVHTMRPGQTWLLAHGNYTVGHEDSIESYNVTVKLADDCPEWEGRSNGIYLGPNKLDSVSVPDPG